MDVNTALLAIKPVVQWLHRRGILSVSWSYDATGKRVLAVMTRHNEFDLETQAGPEAFRHIVESWYLKSDYIEGIPGAIVVFASHPHSTTARHAHTHPTAGGRECFMVDIEVDDVYRSLIVPLEVFEPYKGRAPRRTENILDGMEPVPLWVITAGGLGAPIDKLAVPRHSDRRFMNHELTKVRSSVTVIIKWPGCEEWNAQIQMGHGTVSERHTFRRLVNQMNSIVCKFIRENTGVVSRESRWAISKPGQGGISVRDLELLAVVVTSKGAIMPILKVRDGFEFAHPTTSSYGGVVPQQPLPATSYLQPPIPPAHWSSSTSPLTSLQYPTSSTFLQYTTSSTSWQVSTTHRGTFYDGASNSSATVPLFVQESFNGLGYDNLYPDEDVLPDALFNSSAYSGSYNY